MSSEIQLAQSALAAGTIQRQINHCCADTARMTAVSGSRITAKPPRPLGGRPARLRRIRRRALVAPPVVDRRKDADVSREMHQAVAPALGQIDIGDSAMNGRSVGVPCQIDVLTFY